MESLLLSCRALSSPTTCRFIPAHLLSSKALDESWALHRHQQELARLENAPLSPAAKQMLDAMVADHARALSDDETALAQHLKPLFETVLLNIAMAPAAALPSRTGDRLLDAVVDQADFMAEIFASPAGQRSVRDGLSRLAASVATAREQIAHLKN